MALNTLSRLFLDGLDATPFLEDVPLVSITAPEYGQLIPNDLPNLRGINIDGYWDRSNDASPFFGESDTTVFLVTIQQNDAIVFTGRVESIQITDDYMGADIVIRSEISRAIDNGCDYVSTSLKYPSEIVREICELYSIPFDPLSFSLSDQVYALNNIQVHGRIFGDIAIIQVFQAVAQVGIARIYVINDTLAYEAYYVPTASPLITISNDPLLPVCNMLTDPKPQTLPKQASTAITVNWFGGPALIGAGTTSSLSIPGGNTDAIQIMSLPAAVWIGTTWLEYLNRIQNSIQVGVVNELAKDIEISMPVSIQYLPARWNLLGDVTSIVLLDAIESMITVITRD